MDQVTIAPGHWLGAGAAASYARMREAGMPGGINDAGRTHAEQAHQFHDNYTTDYSSSAKTDPRTWNGRTYWRRKARVSGGKTVAVAVPGTSRHETGLAIDVPESVRAWLREHGAAHGWENPEWAKDTKTFEPWHWEYTASNDTKGDDDMATPAEVWGYKNLSMGNTDAWQRLNNAERDAAEALKVAKSPVDLDALATKVAAKIPAIDYAKLAKAVNDDAAKRMQA